MWLNAFSGDINSLLLILAFFKHAFSFFSSTAYCLLVCCCYSTSPRDGGKAEDHGCLEAGLLSIAWTKGRKDTESRQRARGAESP